MYKPRIVKFKDRKVDTRIGSCGLYPGDVVNIHSTELLVLGIDVNAVYPHIMVANLRNKDVFGYIDPSDLIGKPMTRHASKKLLKQMKQV